jgi:hypothetical protein
MQVSNLKKFSLEKYVFLMREPKKQLKIKIKSQNTLFQK